MRSLALTLVLLAGPVCADIPAAAWQYRADMLKSAWRTFGPGAPVATLAAQIHQESAWKADAESWAGAQGLAQFMPGTAADMARRFPAECAPANPHDSRWQFRCRDRYLKGLIRASENENTTECDAWAFGLRSYNGGRRHLLADIQFCRDHPPASRFCGATQSAETLASERGANFFFGVANLALDYHGTPLGLFRFPYTVAHAVSVYRVLPPEFGVFAEALAHFGAELWPRFAFEGRRHFVLGLVGMVLSEEMIIRPESAVFPVMLAVSHGFEVFGTEVGPVVIDVVDEDFSGEGDTKQPFCNKPMDVERGVFAVAFETDCRIAVEKENVFVANSGFGHHGAEFSGYFKSHKSTCHDESNTNVACKCDADNWKHVGMVNAGRRESAFKENTEYPERIFNLTPEYLEWGEGLDCL